MRAIAFEPYTMIKVIWLDIVQDPAWQRVTEAIKGDPLKITTVGFYLSGKNKKLNMCHSYTEDGESDSLVIPWGCVASVEEIKSGSSDESKTTGTV